MTMPGTLLLGALVMALLGRGSAFAGEGGGGVEVLAQRIVELEAEVRELDIQLKPQIDSPEAVQRRLIDAEVLYELKNYESAATILLDLCEKHPNSPEYPEAIYLLGDSLYLKRDFLSARRYFEKSVELGPTSKHYQAALERLIELALHTGEYGPVDSYLEKLGQVPDRSKASSVPYVKGKYFYFRQRYGDALQILGTLARTSDYWFQAQYFIGASRVAQLKPGEAVQVFDALIKEEPKTDSERRVVELSHLALGRIYYDQGQLASATLEYGKINQTSDLFNDALYEGAWVAIKDKFYQKAFRSLDLLLTVQPEGPQVPEVRLLMGNLQIRQTEWDGATATFTKTRDDFDVVRQQVEAALAKQGDGQTFFKDLLSRNLSKFDLAAYFPPAALKWLQKDPDLDRLGTVLGDVSDLQKAIVESDGLIVRLEKALEGPSRVNIFPELAVARTKALGTGNRLIDIENALLSEEQKLIGPAIGEDKAQLEKVSKGRQQLEKQLADLPRGNESYQERIRRTRAAFDELDKRAVEINVIVSSYTAELVAIEKYFHDTGQDQRPEVKALFDQEIGAAKAIERELTAKGDGIRREIAEGGQAVGVDDDQMQQEALLKKALAEAIDAEHDLFAHGRDRLDGSARANVDQCEAILARARKAVSAVAGFNARIDSITDQKLGEIKVVVAEEKAHVAEYQQRLGGYANDTSDVGNQVARQTFKNVRERFYQIVVRADVGIIDVSWALKQSRTDESSRLVREKKRDLKLLDDEFKEVLKD